MVRTIGSFIGVSKQIEMLIMLTSALLINIFDMAIFDLAPNLEQVWTVEMDSNYFATKTQYTVRMLLSGILFIRTFTLHLYIAFLIAAFWPVLIGTRPTLMLPWILISAVKNLGTGVVSCLTGIYTCMVYGPFRPACIQFFGSQIVDIFPSLYMWMVGISLYRDLTKPQEIDLEVIKSMEDQEISVAVRRRLVKSMITEETLRQQLESKNLNNKFLGSSAMEVKEIINTNNYKNLSKKYSRSLDSLLDVLKAQSELMDTTDDSDNIEIESNLTLQEKTAKLLGISISKIMMIKEDKQAILPKIHSSSKKLIETSMKLLPETSFNSPQVNKLLRSTKSELKSSKEFLKLKTPSEFIIQFPEKEIKSFNLDIADKKSNSQEDIQSINNNINNNTINNNTINNNTINNNTINNNTINNNTINNNNNNESDVKDSFENISTSKTESNEKGDSVDAIIKKSDPVIETCIADQAPIVKKSNESLQEKTVSGTNSTVEQPISRIPFPKFKNHFNKSEFGCQVSTLSKKILEINPKQLIDNLSTTSRKTLKRKTFDIKAPLKITKLEDKSTVVNNVSSFRSAKLENSYSQIHKTRMEWKQQYLTGTSVHKFEKSESTILEDGYTRMYKLGYKNKSIGEKNSSTSTTRKLSNATCKS